MGTLIKRRLNQNSYQCSRFPLHIFSFSLAALMWRASSSEDKWQKAAETGEITSKCWITGSSSNPALRLDHEVIVFNSHILESINWTHSFSFLFSQHVSFSGACRLHFSQQMEKELLNYSSTSCRIIITADLELNDSALTQRAAAAAGGWNCGLTFPAQTPIKQVMGRQSSHSLSIT